LAIYTIINDTFPISWGIYFIDGGNRSNLWKQPTCNNKCTNVITKIILE